MTAPTDVVAGQGARPKPAPRPWRSRLVPLMPAGRRPLRTVERNAVTYARVWWIFLTGFAEPILFLLSIGVGVGELVGGVPGPGGRELEYKVFVAPGLIAVSAMNGSILDTTFNFFVKYKYLRLYDGILATPMATGDVALGEVAWALLRGAAYAAGFVLTMWAMGLVLSPWAILAVPVALLIGFAFAGAGLAATTYMRSFVDFDYVNLAIIPMFLFSATFFPLSRYPDALGWIVQATPLYQGVALERAVVVGELSWVLVVHAAYLLAMGWVGVTIAARRLDRLLLP